MTNLTLHRETGQLIKPEPRSPITIRPAVPGAGGRADLRFIDELQKKHSKQVGWFALAWFEKNIELGNVLIAEDGETKERIGYVLYKDKYHKREDLGICYQLNIAPHKQRGLVGAALIQAAFERCPYGVKLFCCWCAQDIQANHFWESIGFVPLAFRAGSRGKDQGGRRSGGQRVHIFWQKRIREGDVETPWWYPTETQGGAMKENRIVLPIQPGTHWSEAKPIVLPGAEQSAVSDQQSARALPAKRERKPKAKKPVAASLSESNGLRFGPPPETLKAPHEPKPKREKQRNDPKLVAAAREFRDRYLDEVNSGAGRCLLQGDSKYDVSRQLPPPPPPPPMASTSEPTIVAPPLLDAA